MRLFTPGLVVGLLVSHVARAGDCQTHPLNVYELQVTRCEALDVKNAQKVSFSNSQLEARGVKPADVQAAFAVLVLRAGAAFVLEGTLTRSTRITFESGLRHPASAPTPPQVSAWRVEDRPVAVLLQPTPSAKPGVDACSQYARGPTVLVEFPTNCSCDTGPLNGQWCWLNERAPVREAAAATKKLLKL
ncbi:MAG: hypothetical protein JNJ54_14900 [Myxococcaceae bacterium]|nr:hypothetical protein [Myxococcaceae bacterium]